MRDEYEDFETDYFEHVQQNLPAYYSDFVTRFVVEFAGLLIPWWRVAILPGAKGEYYANSELIKAAIRGKQEAGFSIEAMFFQDSFPTFLRLVDVAEGKLAKDDPNLRVRRYAMTVLRSVAEMIQNSRKTGS